MPNIAPTEDKQTRLGRIVEVTNKIVQTLAIVIAGVWALWTWGKTTAPGLKTGLTVSGRVGEFSWRDSWNACVGSVDVTIENSGQRNIVVSRVDYKVSEATPTRLELGEKIKVPDTTPELTNALTKGNLPFLNGAYPPKTAFHWNVPLLLSRDMTKQLWFEVEAFDPANKRLEFWYGTIHPCGENEPAPSPAPAGQATP